MRKIRINWDIIICRIAQILPWPFDGWVKEWHMARLEQWHEREMRTNPAYKTLIHNIIHKSDGEEPTKKHKTMTIEEFKEWLNDGGDVIYKKLTGKSSAEAIQDFRQI